MRWEQLFDELGAQYDRAEEASLQAELGSRVRAEHGRLVLRDRLGGAVGSSVSLSCRGVGELDGRLVQVGVDWLLLADPQARDVLVPIAAVRSVGGLGVRTTAGPAAGAVTGRLDLRWALRGLVRDRQVVQLLVDDGSVLVGTLDRVGADFTELAEHHLDEPRRRGAVRGVRAVPLDAVAAVRSIGA